MIDYRPLTIEDRSFVGITIYLPKTTLIMITAKTGYIMCGALDVQQLNTKLKHRKIIAGRAVGVSSIDDLLEAPLESVTNEAENLGITKGMTGREALLKMPSGLC